MNLAPNGKPSKLTAEQYRLVRTSAFKDWFGDWENSPESASKVVDENGEPLVLWHGSYAHEKFNSFDTKRIGDYGMGSYFAKDKATASSYSTNSLVYECFLSIKNPYKEKSNFYGNTKSRMSERKDLIKNKFDGKFIEKVNWYVAFHSNQIKLADGTNTTFDANNNDIRYKEGGITKAFNYSIGGL